MERESYLVGVGLTALSSVFTLALYTTRTTPYGDEVEMDMERERGREGSDQTIYPPISQFPGQVDCLGNMIGGRKNVEDSRQLFTTLSLVSRQKGLKEELVGRCGGRYV